MSHNANSQNANSKLWISMVEAASVLGLTWFATRLLLKKGKIEGMRQGEGANSKIRIWWPSVEAFCKKRGAL